MRNTPGTTPRAAAETLALQALAWLMGEDGRAGAFLAATGIGPAALRAQAGSAMLAAAVLDHLLADEALLLDFCGGQGLPPTAIAEARRHLPGGDLPHWT
jgi:hypothetical protein